MRTAGDVDADLRDDILAEPRALDATIDDPGATGEMDAAPARRELDEIIAVISHDLRGPLSALSVAIDALDDDDIDRATRKRYADAMRRAIGRAERFLTDLLDVGRIESGTLRVEPHPTPLIGLLEEAARRNEELAREAGNWFTIEASHAALTIVTDRERMLQALDALIGNAIRFARGTGPITLRAETGDDERLRLWVVDRGPGIPHGQADRLFEGPWRARDERRTGAGLGLVIARGIAEAHGGALSAVSRPGEGARFCVELPLSGAR
jgi:signal transduction histidine kinase